MQYYDIVICACVIVNPVCIEYSARSIIRLSAPGGASGDTTIKLGAKDALPDFVAVCNRKAHSHLCTAFPLPRKKNAPDSHRRRSLMFNLIVYGRKNLFAVYHMQQQSAKDGTTALASLKCSVGYCYLHH